MQEIWNWILANGPLWFIGGLIGWNLARLNRAQREIVCLKSRINYLDKEALDLWESKLDLKHIKNYEITDIKNRLLILETLEEERKRIKSEEI